MREGREGEEQSDDAVGATQAHPSGELLQQARDGARGAGCEGLQAHRGAVGRQEHLPHSLQPHLPLQRTGTPGDEGGGGARSVIVHSATDSTRISYRAPLK